MIGQGESRTRFFVAYGYSVVAALLVLSQALIELVRGEGATQWLIGIAAAVLLSLVPGSLARHVPGPIWLTPVVLGIGAGLVMFPALGFIASALR
jgi:hypothetical protein